MINKEINEQIISVYHKHSQHFNNSEDIRIPIFYNEFQKGGILFVGMNPSTGGIESKILTDDEKINYKLNHGDKITEQVDYLAGLEKRFIGKSKSDAYPYFRPMWQISNEVGFDKFQHIDLFIYPETNQSKFTKMVVESEKSKKIVFNQFGQEQINIFKNALENIDPEIIIVSNAKASKIFQDTFKDDLKPNHDKGCHIFKNKTLVFFSSMLSGQRALDTYSRDRLIWHINKIK